MTIDIWWSFYCVDLSAVVIYIGFFLQHFSQNCTTWLLFKALLTKAVLCFRVCPCVRVQCVGSNDIILTVQPAKHTKKKSHQKNCCAPLGSGLARCLTPGLSNYSRPDLLVSSPEDFLSHHGGGWGHKIKVDQVQSRIQVTEASFEVKDGWAQP